MKKSIIILFVTLFMSANVFADDYTVSNKLFSVTLPKEAKKVVETKIKKDKISIYHKESKKAGFGGFIFGIKAYKNPSEHAMLPGGSKIGELTDKKGVLYDMVLKYPTDVQYDYTKQEPENYKMLYDLGKTVEIKGIKGSTYHKNQGMKGKDLYKDVLSKHIKAIKEKWDSTKLENEDMSYMYNVISQTNKNPLNKVGYAYYDANGDGIDELFIGEIAKGEFKGVIYDMYTMVDRIPTHVTSGWARNRYFVSDDYFICREYSSGANESGWDIYVLVENSTELFPQVSFKYDGYENSKKPWFISYSDEKWNNVDEKTFNERKKVFEKYTRFNYTPLNQIKNF